MHTQRVFVSNIIAAVLFLAACSTPEKNQVESRYPISAVDIKQVILTDSFWLPKLKLIRDTTIKHAFQKCAEEGRMDNFLVAGKVKPGKVRGAMPFDDTDLYKIIEGASYSLISMPDAKFESYLDSIITIIKAGQEPDGYITTWFTIDRMNPPATWVKPASNRWEGEYMSHELYNSGHLFEAAAAHYWATGKRNFLDIALRNADLLVANFKPGKVTIPPGHQIVETGLIKLYDITQNADYLTLSKFFIDLRGDSSTHKLYGPYSQDHVPVTQQMEAVGHAVRAEYMYAGMTDLAAAYKDASYSNALNKLWNNTVDTKTYITGGVGAIHEGEQFGKDYELPNLTAYAETCASIGSVWWNQKMFLLSGDSKYYDILERTLYNGLLSGVSVDGKKFFYTNPLESDGQFLFNKGSCTRQSWFDCSCCPTNMIRFLPSIGGLIYATREDTIYTNLFISSEARIGKDGDIKISQQTDYPWSGKVVLKLETEKPRDLSLKIRIPGWAQGQAFPGKLYSYQNTSEQGLRITINGQVADIPVSNGYATITRTWETGEFVELDLPMVVHRVVTTSAVQDNVNKVAFELGPIVYCAEEVDNKGIEGISLPRNLSMQYRRADVLDQSVNVIDARVGNYAFTLIPYYLWSNRGVGKMKVWFPETK